jgi:hypothetical protein
MEQPMTLYVTKNEQRLGPYSLAEVQSLLAAGTLLPTDWAWYEGVPQWIPLHQVPGIAPANQPPSHTARPILVWIICLFFFIWTPFSLFSVIRLPLTTSHDPNLSDSQRHFLADQAYLDHGPIILNSILFLTWAILFFMLKRQSLYVLLVALGLALSMLIYNLVVKDWISLAGIRVLVSIALVWTLNLSVLYYNWRLFRKGILR